MAPAAAAAPAEAPSAFNIQESFVKSDQIDDREGGNQGREKSEGEAMFPGIAEGLSPEYLEPGWAQSEPFEGHQLRSLGPPAITVQQVLACSETAHLRSKLEGMLSKQTSAAQSLLTTALEDEELLALFIEAEGLGDRAEFVSELSDMLELEIQESDLWNTDLYSHLEGYSKGLFSHRYALQLVAQAKAVINNYFPEVFMELPVIVKVLEAQANNAGHEWVSGKHRITLEVKEPFGSSRHDIADLVSTGSFGEGYQFRRGVTDLVSFVHEYGHAIYDKNLGVPASNKVDRVNRALSEGFSVLLELLTIDCLQGELSPMDSRDLLERRRQRVTWLQGALAGEVEPSQMAYAEGTEFMVNLFRESGLGGVSEFLSAIKPVRADALSRSNPRYREAIADPDLMLELVG